MYFLNKWEWFKFKVRQIAIRASKHSSNLKRQKQQDIICEINHLCYKDELSMEEHVKLNNLQSQLDNIYIYGKSKGCVYTF